MIVHIAVLIFLCSAASSFALAETTSVDDKHQNKGRRREQKPRPDFLWEHAADSHEEGNGHRVLRRSSAGTPSIIVGNLGQVENPHNNNERSLLELLKQGDAQVAQAALNTIQGIVTKHLGGTGKEQMTPALTSNKMIVDERSNVHYRFTEVIQGFPVDNAAMVMHTTANGTVFAVNGEFVADKNFSVVPKINAAAALAMALSAVNRTGAHWEDQQADLRIVYTLDGVGKLAWYNILTYNETNGAQKKEKVYISAMTGEILMRVNMILSGSLRSHGSTVKSDAVRPSNSLTRPASKSRGLTSGVPSVITLNCYNQISYCTLASNSSSRIHTGDAGVDGAHNYAIATYEYYYNNFGRDSLDDKGMTLVSRAHYDSYYDNAFWDGFQATYGDGYGPYGFDPTGLADIVGHELTHAVTWYTSNLIYLEEPGALNEALSDIVGAGVDRQEGANITATFLCGEKQVYGAYRSMSNPALFDQPDWYPDRYLGSSDYGGVHINSGIVNLAFYLSVRGGRHPRRMSSVVVPAINATRFDVSLKQAQLIFYKANTACLTPTSDFTTMRYCTADIHGGKYKNNMNLAWDAVGVPKYYAANYTNRAPIALTSGVAVTGQSATTGTYLRYTLSNILPGQVVACRTAANNGDADLFVLLSPSNPGIECYDDSYSSRSYCVTGQVTVPSVALVAVFAYDSYTYLGLTCTAYAPHQLTNAVVLSQQSAGVGTLSFYRLRGVSRFQSVTCRLAGSSGIAHMFMAFAHGAAPQSGNLFNTCENTDSTRNKMCKTGVPEVDNSDLYVTLSAQQAYTTNITCTKNNPIALTKGVALTGQRANYHDIVGYELRTPIAGSVVTCRTTGSNGDVNLFVRFGAPAFADPEFMGNACHSDSSDSSESCTTGPVPANTRVFITLFAHAAYTGVSLVCSQ